MGKLIQTNIVAGVVIKQDGKYLLVRENRPGTKVHGLWNFPAGRVEKGYTIEETAVKEAKEEAGYDVELIRKLGIFQTHAQTPPKHAFAAKIVGGNLQWPKDEILDARWFTYEEIQGMKDKLREEWIIGAIRIMESNNIMEQPPRPKVGVGVMIFKEGRILLSKRKGSHGQGEYAFPGGHLEYLESFADCARRETKEECGIEIKNIRFQFLANVTKYAPKHYVHIGLLADWRSGEAEILEPEKSELWDWYEIDNLPQPMFEMCKIAIESYKSGMNYYDILGDDVK